MEAAARSIPDAEPVFEDALGQRYRSSETAGGQSTEILVLRPSFASVPSFEFALRERASRLGTFRHAYYARTRSIERTTGIEPCLKIVSDAGQGLRLSDVLVGAQARRVPIDINAALCLIRQLVPAIAMLHESARDVAHGAIATDRLMVTPQARLLIVEYILGAALEQLRYPRERYWNELRIALPPGQGAPRFDHRADVMQIGIVALSLILGRQLREGEFPSRIADVVASTWAVSPRGGFEPLPPGLRGWLGRALQIDPSRSFQSAVEARAELDAVLGDSDLVASPASLEAFLTRYHAAEPQPSEAAIKPAPLPRVAAPPPRPTPVATMPPVTETPKPPAPVPVDPPITPLSMPVAELPTAPQSRDSDKLHVAETSSSPDLDVSSVGEDDGEAGDKRFNVNWRVVSAIAAVVVVVAAGATIAARRPSAEPVVHAASGTLEIATNPAGAEALIDGELRGATPLVLALEPGSHTVELRGAGEPRTIPVTINPGMKVSQYVELNRTSATPVKTPEPSTQPSSSAAEPVVAAPAPATGFVTLESPVDLQVFESGTLVGTAHDRLSLAPGRHELALANADLGVHTTSVVQVNAGKTASVTVQLPTGTLSLNAVPWAEVWIDGEKVGETPLGNYAVRVGPHDVVFRHPDLGERHQTIVVSTKEPTRLSVDLRAR